MNPPEDMTGERQRARANAATNRPTCETCPKCGRLCHAEKVAPISGAPYWVIDCPVCCWMCSAETPEKAIKAWIEQGAKE